MRKTLKAGIFLIKSRNLRMFDESQSLSAENR